MYILVNEDKVVFAQNDFTDGNYFHDEDDTIDDDEKNDETIIDVKYLDDEELWKSQKNKQFKKRNGITNYKRM